MTHLQLELLSFGVAAFLAVLVFSIVMLLINSGRHTPPPGHGAASHAVLAAGAGPPAPIPTVAASPTAVVVATPTTTSRRRWYTLWLVGWLKYVGGAIVATILFVLLAILAFCLLNFIMPFILAAGIHDSTPLGSTDLGALGGWASQLGKEVSQWLIMLAPLLLCAALAWLVVYLIKGYKAAVAAASIVVTLGLIGIMNDGWRPAPFAPGGTLPTYTASPNCPAQPEIVTVSGYDEAVINPGGRCVVHWAFDGYIDVFSASGRMKGRIAGTDFLWGFFPESVRSSTGEPVVVNYLLAAN